MSVPFFWKNYVKIYGLHDIGEYDNYILSHVRPPFFEKIVLKILGGHGFGEYGRYIF